MSRIERKLVGRVGAIPSCVRTGVPGPQSAHTCEISQLRCIFMMKKNTIKSDLG